MVLCKRPLTTYNLYRERNCCTIHIAKATDVFSSHDCIFHVEQVPTDWQFLFSACGVNMLPPWALPLRHGHSCMYTRSVFERKKMNCDTVVIHACTRGLSTLQRLQMCSRATIASSTWNKYQLIDNLYSLLAASICCHRGRCRCDTAIHACTRGLSLNEKKWIATQ